MSQAITFSADILPKTPAPAESKIRTEFGDDNLRPIGKNGDIYTEKPYSPYKERFEQALRKQTEEDISDESAAPENDKSEPENPDAAAVNVAIPACLQVQNQVAKQAVNSNAEGQLGQSLTGQGQLNQTTIPPELANKANTTNQAQLSNSGENQQNVLQNQFTTQAAAAEKTQAQVLENTQVKSDAILAESALKAQNAGENAKQQIPTPAADRSQQQSQTQNGDDAGQLLNRFTAANGENIDPKNNTAGQQIKTAGSDKTENLKSLEIMTSAQQQANKATEESTPDVAKTMIGTSKNQPDFAEHINALDNQPDVRAVRQSAKTVQVGAKSDSAVIGPEDVGQQVVRAVNNRQVSVEQDITIALNPPELGRIRIRFIQNAGEITGLVEVEKPQTRYELDKHMSEVAAALQQNGVQVRRIEVVQTQNTPNEGNKGNSSEEFPGQLHEETSRQMHQRQGQSNNEQGTVREHNSRMHRDLTEPKAGMQIGDDAINFYV